MADPDVKAAAAPDGARTEPADSRYLALLESQRSEWWDSANFDKWKSHYISEYPRGFFILDQLARYAPEFAAAGSRVLDVGCGDAGVPVAFAEAGAEAYGIEPFEKSVERGRVRAEEHGVRVDLRAGFAEALPFPDGTFDLVMMDNVLEHVEHREQSLAEVKRVLKPRGLLYLVTPKPFALHSLWSDPHYAMAGLVLMPRALQKVYFERVRGGGAGSYGVGLIPTRRWVARRLAGLGFELLARPRDLWIEYMRQKITQPGELSSAPRRRLARWVSGHPALLDHPIARAGWDVALGSNFFIARRAA